MSRAALIRYVCWSGLVLFAIEAAGLWYLKVLPFSRIDVVNTSDVRDIYWNPEEVSGSVYTSPSGVMHVAAGPNYGIFPTIRKTIEQSVPDLDTASDFERVLALKLWAHGRFAVRSRVGDYAMFDYRKSDAFAALFVGASLSLGIPARLVHLNTSSDDGFEGHYIAEAWVRDVKKWVAVDPLFNTIYTVRGIPASTLEIHNAFFVDPTLGVPNIERHGARINPALPQYEELRSLYAHFQVVNRTDFDDYGIPLWGKKLQFINWVDEVSPPLGNQERVLRMVTLLMLPGILAAEGTLLIIMMLSGPHSTRRARSFGVFRRCER